MKNENFREISIFPKNHSKSASNGIFTLVQLPVVPEIPIMVLLILVIHIPNFANPQIVFEINKGVGPSGQTHDPRP